MRVEFSTVGVDIFTVAVACFTRGVNIFTAVVACFTREVNIFTGRDPGALAWLPSSGAFGALS